MRLSESGELGLLAELERLGLIVGVAARRRAARRRRRRDPGRARRRRPLSARLALLARARLAGCGRQPERPRGLGGGAGGTARDARRARIDPNGGRGRALPRPGRDRGARGRRRHDARTGARRLGDGARQQRARSRSCRRAARRPARRHRPARRRRCCVPRAAATSARRFGSQRGARSPGTRTR